MRLSQLYIEAADLASRRLEWAWQGRTKKASVAFSTVLPVESKRPVLFPRWKRVRRILLRKEVREAPPFLLREGLP